MNFGQNILYRNKINKHGDLSTLVAFPEMIFFRNGMDKSPIDFSRYMKQLTEELEINTDFYFYKVNAFEKFHKTKKVISLYTDEKIPDSFTEVKIIQENDFLEFFEAFSILMCKMGFSYSVKSAHIACGSKTFNQMFLENRDKSELKLEEDFGTLSSLNYRSKIGLTRMDKSYHQPNIKRTSLSNILLLVSRTVVSDIDLIKIKYTHIFAPSDTKGEYAKEFIDVFNPLGVIEYHKEKLPTITNPKLKEKVEKIVALENENGKVNVDLYHFGIALESLLSIHLTIYMIIQDPIKYEDCFKLLNKYTMQLITFNKFAEHIDYIEYQNRLMELDVLMDITETIFKIKSELNLVFEGCNIDPIIEDNPIVKDTGKSEEEIALEIYKSFST